MCIWTDKNIKDDEDFVEETKSCQIPNVNIYDESMFVGRIQINLNDGKNTIIKIANLDNSDSYSFCTISFFPR